MKEYEDLVKIFYDLSQTAIINVILIVAGALFLIAVGQRMLVWVAN